MATYLYPPVSVTTLPPVGGATAANQVLEIADLDAIKASEASIDAKTPALVGGKSPVDTGLTQPLTDTQLRANPVPVSGFPATQNVAINGVTEDRNSGAAGANTLRTVLATRHEAVTTPLAQRESDGTNFLSSIALTVAQLTSGALTAIRMGASIIMGWDGSTHRELSVDNTGKLNTNVTFPTTQNVAINGLTEDRNSGAATANTLRTVLATRHEAAATPLAQRASDGTNFLSSIALAAAQLTSGALTAIRMSAAVIMGWDGTTHREIAVDTSGNQKMVQQATTPTYAESSSVNGSTVTTLNAPAGAKGCKVILPGNSTTMNITVDGTTAPTNTATGVGIEMQGGRSEDFVGVGSLKAICQNSADTAQKISVHWYV